MSRLHTFKMGGDVHKDRSVSKGAFSLNGHDSSYIMSAKKAVFLCIIHTTILHISYSVYMFDTMTDQSINDNMLQTCSRPGIIKLLCIYVFSTLLRKAPVGYLRQERAVCAKGRVALM
jgi:hypothetical protein